MSDWLQIPDNPTLAVHFPWDKTPMVTCLNCNKRILGGTSPHNITHEWVDRYTPGCGIKFEFITTSAVGAEWCDSVCAERPDLKWKAVAWG